MTRCPALTDLERLLDEQLDEAESSVCCAHVESCPACQEALERLTAGDSLSSAPPAVTNTVPEPFLSRLKQASFGPVGHTTTPAATKPPAVPGYEIVRELGRGGMGVVYLARQTSLNRFVALKMILAGSHADARDRARFRSEAEAAARLHHPNIVQIYETGEVGGLPYFGMEYAERGNLGQFLQGEPQPLHSAARFVETLARAVHFAHLRNVVHRDLKPANILLCESPEIASPSALVPGIPKLTDFGLAKRLDQHGVGTHSRDFLGTPSYMAPEQADPQRGPASQASDIYALGAILYEMLTGRPPFKGATPLDTVVQLLHEEPVRPARLRPGLPIDLETVCLKCLQKEPSHRYPSAEALAEDLKRYRTGKPIVARPVGSLARLWKSARRRPLTAAMTAGMLLSVMLGLVGVVVQWRHTVQARDDALREKQDKEAERLQAVAARADALAERGRARVALYFSSITQSQLQWRVGNVTGAVQSLSQGIATDGQEQRGWEWYYLYGLFHSDLITLRHPHPGSGGCAAYDPAGRVIASVVGGRSLDEEEHPGEVRIWDAATGDLLRAFRVPGTSHRLAFRPDGKCLAVATTDGAVLMYDTQTGDVIARTQPSRQMIPTVTYSPDGRHIAIASWDHTVTLLDASTGRADKVLRGHTARVQCVAFHPNGRRLVSGDADALVKVWDLETGTEKETLRGHVSPVYGVAFSPDGRWLASGGSNGNLKIWDTAAGRVVQSLTGRSGALLDSCFSPDGRYLAYSGGDATVRVWDVESGSERFIFRGHTGPVESVRFSPDGQRIVSSCPSDATVKVWDFTRHPEHATFARVRSRTDEQVKVRDLTGRADATTLARTGPDLEAIAFHADRRHLVSVAVGGKLQTWDAATGVLFRQQTIAMSDELVSPAVLAAFAPGGERLAARARGDDRLLRIWDTATGSELMELTGHTVPVYAVRFSPDGRYLASCGCDVVRPEKPHEVIVWDATTGARSRTFTGRGLLFCAAFSPDGNWLAAGGDGGAVLLINWKIASQFQSLPGHTGPVAAVAFSTDGRLLASGGLEDRTVRVVDLGHGDTGHSSRANILPAPPFLCDLAFSPDGFRLAGISRDVVRLWDTRTFHEVIGLRGAPQRHWDPIFNPRIAFSPNGRRLVGSNWDESISMWDASIPDDKDAIKQLRISRRSAADARAPAWHLQEAEVCHDHQNTAAARFHLQRLGQTPLPEPLRVRKEQLIRLLDKRE